MGTMGARLKRLRDEKGISQQELARQCGVTQATISRLESGELQDMQTSTARRLARALGVSVDYLIGTWDEESDLVGASQGDVDY
jgi:transcriptional regulator with XRE-family HTH domain